MYCKTQFNKIFELHQSNSNLIESIIIPINKPGKEKIVENTRPIQLLSTKRKILSRILLDSMIQIKVEKLDFPQKGHF